jgi:hypothetical protein
MSQTRNDGLISRSGGLTIPNEAWQETLVEQRVTHSLDVDGRFILIENVPARVNVESGERLFAPETVERLQQIAWKLRKPNRVIQTPVFEYTG